MIAGAERAEMIGVIAPIEFRMLIEDRVVAGLEVGAPNFQIALGEDLPGALVTLAPVMGAAVRNGFFDGAAYGVKMVGQIARVEVGLHRHHAAADIDTDGRGNDS